MTTRQRQVLYMPWAGITERKVQVGPVLFWRFAHPPEDAFKDSAIREHLSKYFNCYVDLKGAPASANVAICSHGPYRFHPICGKQRSDIVAARDALLFSGTYPHLAWAVATGNRSLPPPAAERYAMKQLDFTPGDDNLSVRTLTTLHVGPGMQIGSVKFPPPEEVGGMYFYTDRHMLEAFGKLLSNSNLAQERQRIFRSLEWFRLAHSRSGPVSELAMVVMMTTAFEILLSIPDGKWKRLYLAKETDRRLRTPASLPETRPDDKGKPYSACKAAWWAWDFYILRNNIVHGGEIQDLDLVYDRKWLQVIVSAVVFGECLEWELRELGLYAKPPTTPPKLPQHLPPGVAKALPHAVTFEEVHRALGWLKY